MKFRKKPVVVEAVQITHAMLENFATSGGALPAGVSTRFERAGLASTLATDAAVFSVRAFVKTLEGEMTITPGDWLITGVKGEKYPCKPDIFEATYEPVGD